MHLKGFFLLVLLSISYPETGRAQQPCSNPPPPPPPGQPVKLVPNPGLVPGPPPVPENSPPKPSEGPTGQTSGAPVIVLPNGTNVFVQSAIPFDPTPPCAPPLSVAPTAPPPPTPAIPNAGILGNPLAPNSTN